MMVLCGVLIATFFFFFLARSGLQMNKQKKSMLEITYYHTFKQEFCF